MRGAYDDLGVIYAINSTGISAVLKTSIASVVCLFFVSTQRFFEGSSGRVLFGIVSRRHHTVSHSVLMTFSPDKQYQRRQRGPLTSLSKRTSVYEAKSLKRDLDRFTFHRTFFCGGSPVPSALRRRVQGHSSFALVAPTLANR